MAANEMKTSATTTHEAKKAVKVMAESIAKLTLDAINVICTYHVYEVQVLEAINHITDKKLRIALLSEYKTIAFSNENFIFSSSKIAPAFNQQGGGI